MEFDWPTADNPEEEEDKNEKPRKRRKFWPPWLAKPGKDVDPGVEAEADDKPPSKLIETFRKLFGRHVETEHLEDFAETEYESEALWSSWEVPDPAEENKYAEATAENEASSTEPAGDKEDGSAESEPQETELGVLKIDHDESDLEPETMTLPIPEVYNPYFIDSSDQTALPREPEINNPLPDKNETTASRPVRRGEPLAAATLAGLWLEHAGRKRQDKKQEKRTELVEQKVDTNTQQIEDLTRNQAAMNKDTVRPQERLATPPKKPPIARHEQLSRREPNAEGLRPRGLTNSEAEPVKGSIDKEQLAKQVAEKVELHEREHHAPADVLKEMLTAAEVNAPIEKIYERRQEVRDEPAFSQGQGAASVGSILHSLKGTGGATISRQASIDDRHDQNTHDTPTAALLYRQAVQRGFWAAVVILVFALLAYLIG